MTSLPLIVGYSLSAAWITKGFVELFPFVISSLLVFCITSYLRLKNDFEDFEKDSIAFTDRPLPRGLISRRAAQEVIQYLEYILAGFLGTIFIFYPTETKFIVLLLGGYLWLMGHKFYLPRWQKRSPLLREILGQAFLILLTLLIIAIWAPTEVFFLPSLSYTLIVFGAVFVNDLCRKLDPYAHPASLSFIHYYG
ncbi:MAG TPA: UbiA family prenyltransferase, partial [Waddliaceae bacterium]